MSARKSKKGSAKKGHRSSRSGSTMDINSTAPDEDEALNSIERQELHKKLRKVRMLIDVMMHRRKKLKIEIKRLLEIKGDTRNSGSIFDRLNISPNLDFERILEYEFDDPEFANSIPTVEAILTADGRIATTQNPLDLLMNRQFMEKMGSCKKCGPNRTGTLVEQR